MKVKIFSDSSLYDLENRVNDFISTVNVIEIKMSSFDKGTDILVIYNEKGAE